MSKIDQAKGILKSLGLPNAHYALSEAAQEVIITYKTKLWNPSTKKFLAELGDLSKKYSKERTEN